MADTVRSRTVYFSPNEKRIDGRYEQGFTVLSAEGRSCRLHGVFVRLPGMLFHQQSLLPQQSPSSYGDVLHRRSGISRRILLQRRLLLQQPRLTIARLAGSMLARSVVQCSAVQPSRGFISFVVVVSLASVHEGANESCFLLAPSPIHSLSLIHI